MLNDEQKHILYVDNGDKPSRFLVNLNDPVEQEEKEIKLPLSERLAERLESINLKESIKNLKTGPSAKLEFSKDDEYENPWVTKLKRLAFVGIAIYVFSYVLKLVNFILKLSYRIGWLGLFFVRFIFIAVKQVYGPIVIKRADKKPVLPFVRQRERQPEPVPQEEMENIEEQPGAMTDKSYLEVVDDYDRLLNEVNSESSLRIMNQLESTDPLESRHQEEPETHKERKQYLQGILERLGKLLGNFYLPRETSAFKRAIYFAVLLAIIALPFKGFSFYTDISDLKGRVLGASELAIEEMMAAGSSVSDFDFIGAREGFSRAEDNFHVAQEEIKDISGFLKVLGTVIPSKQLKLASDADLILEAGILSAEIGNALAGSFSQIFGEEDKEMRQLILELHTKSVQVSRKSVRLAEIMNDIDPEILPTEHQEQFIDIRSKVSMMAHSLDEFADIMHKAKIILGLEQDMRYLAVFQNNTELRGSGGFIGSFALVDLSNGVVKNVKVPGGGSYDTEAGLKERIVAPEPLHLVNPLWHFWDANWWPDWSLSAEKLMWFYERSDGPTVDGVVAFTPTVFERLLELIGPIDMTEQYGVVFTAENFWLETQKLAERKSEETNKPKKIIGDLIAYIMDDLPSRLNKDLFLDLLGVIEGSLSEKHVLFYFADENLQEKIEEYDWGGRIKETDRDYLAVINSNVAGGKSDKVINERIVHRANILPDGSIINEVTIKREHTGIKNEQFTGVRNVNWLRVYVPPGSQLIQAKGFSKPASIYFEDPDASWQIDPDIAEREAKADIEPFTQTWIYEEFGKTVFANWVMVDPGKTAIVTLRYKLPFKLTTVSDTGYLDMASKLINSQSKQVVPYSLLVQKQAGSMGSKFESFLSMPDKFSPVWQYGEKMEIIDQGWQVRDRLETDKFWAIVLEKD